MSKKVTRSDLYQITRNERVVRALESVLNTVDGVPFAVGSMTGGTGAETAGPVNVTMPGAVNTAQFTIDEAGRVTCISATPVPSEYAIDVVLTGTPGDAVTVSIVANGSETLRSKSGVFDAAGQYGVAMSALTVLSASDYVQCYVNTDNPATTTDFYVSVRAL